MNEIKPLTPFRFWAQKVIPLVYDESLSYYELLCKVIDYLNGMGVNFNELLANFTEFSDNMTESFNDLSGEFNDLKEFAYHEFPEYVSDKLDEMAEDGTLTRLIAPYLPFVTPEMFGAVGDGVTDDSVNFKTACDACRDNNALLYCPKKSKYLLSSEITIDRVKAVEAYGEIIAPQGLIIKNVSTQTSDFNYLLQNVNGTVKIEGVKGGMFKIVEATKLELYADSNIADIGSLAYNSFHLGYVPTIEIHSKDTGWINENTFYGGRLSSLTIGDSERVGTYRHNNNHFYNPTLESATVMFYAGSNNYIHNARFEGGNANNITFSIYTTNNVIEKAWTSFNLPTIQGSNPSYVHDESGTNYFINGLIPAIKTQEFIYTKDTKNYDCEKLYPLNGKLHNSSYNLKFYRTDFIPITNGVSFTEQSDVVFFRTRIYIYDENKDPITTEPTIEPFSAVSFSFSSNGYYYDTANRNKLEANFMRFHNNPPYGDTGVHYIQIEIYGYGSADLEYFKFALTTKVFDNTPLLIDNRLRKSSIPTNGEWQDGDYCANVGATQCAGWVYNNGNWHAVGEWV